MTERLPARVCAHFAVGGLLLAALTWMIGHVQAVPAPVTGFLAIAPYVVFTSGLLLSAVFHRSRIFHGLLLLMVCDLTFAWMANRLSAPAGDLLIGLIGVLLPINLALIAFLPESGIFSRSGLIRVGVLTAQAAGIAITIRFRPGQVLQFVERPFVQLLPFERFRGLPHAVLVSFTFGFLLLLLQVARRRFRPTDIGLYWALISSFVALCVVGSVQLSSAGFAAGAMVLLVALLEAFYAMAYFDELTDLPSRRSFNDAKLRLGNTYTIAMVDVDHFKQFNDTFGHDVGDQVLRMVAARLGEVSGGGKAYRYGGEEFAVLFPGKYVDETFPHLERLRRSIEELPFKLRAQERRHGKKRRLSVRRGAKQQTNVTVSIGVAGVSDDKRKADDMVKVADQALYRAKSCGRNCTIIGEVDAAKA